MSESYTSASSSNATENPIPKTRFTGIFLSAEILAIEELSYFEMILLAWIDALYCPDHGGCFASNEYLASKLKSCQENTVAKALSHLRKLGLIEDVSFDGRKRVIRALINRYIDGCQSKAALDKNPRQKVSIGEKSNPELEIYPSPSYIYSKEESKDNTLPPTPKGEAAKAARVCDPSSIKKKIGSHVSLTEAELAELESKHGKDQVAQLIDEMNDYCAASKPKGYKDYAAALRQWMRKRANALVAKGTASKTATNDNEKTNRKYAEAIIHKFPQCGRDLRYQGFMIINNLNGKDVSLRLPPETFKKAFNSMVGVHV